MLKNAENLKPGAIIFIRHPGFISWLIRKILVFEFSHVAYYLGMGQMLEADAGGVQINPVSVYLDDDRFIGEVVDNPLADSKIDAVSKHMLQYLQDNYDYSLLAGNAVGHLLHCRKGLLARLMDQQKSWICSELVSEGLRHGGITLPKIPALMTPKDVYQLLKLKEALRYGR